MADIAFVLGNGESRKGIEINDLKKHGTVFACNAVYRTDNPHYLIAVDPKMVLEIAESDYMLHNQVWTNFNAQYNKVKNKKCPLLPFLLLPSYPSPSCPSSDM